MNRFLKVKSCLAALNYSCLSSDDFQDKLVIQKIVYLLQMKGIKFNYSFNLYVRGPYSPDLTKDIYAHSDELKHLDSKEALSKDDLRMIQDFSKVVELSPSQLEVAARYAFFAFERHQDVATAIANVRGIKGFYPESQIALGISRAKRLLYEPTKDELEQLRKEAEPWELASDSDGWNDDGQG